MKIRLVLIAIILTMVFSSQVAFADEENYESPFNNLMFSDVGKDHENFEAIYFLYNTRVIGGYRNSESNLREYKPDNEINRAEFLKLLLEGTAKANNKSYSKCFPDVPEKEWYSTYVCQAKAEGWINGYPDGNFKPTQTINKVEMLKILGEVLDWSLPEYDSGEPWYKGYLEVATERNLLDEGQLDAMQDRGDVAEMIFRNTQVEELSLKSFSEDYIDNLFYRFEIPFDGAFGPGGVFGPDGPFGPGGPFHTEGRFVIEDKMQILDEDFFTNRYCYYSDDGDYLEIVDDILFEVSNGEIDSIEEGGYDIDGFGVMFCYNGYATTDLQLFTKELRDQYGVKCWMDPTLSTSEDWGFERILCYVQPAEPEFVIEETELRQPINPLDALGDLNVAVYGAKGTLLANEQENLEIFLTDNKDRPISGQTLYLKAYTGIDFVETTEVEEVGNGVYRVAFVSTLSGDYQLNLETENGMVISQLGLEVVPGAFDHAEIIETVEPYQSGNPASALIKFVGKDAYGNVLEYSGENNLAAVSSAGEVNWSYNDGIFTTEVIANDYGMVTVDLIDQNNGEYLGVSNPINFFPIQINMQRGIKVQTERLEVPVGIFVPEKYGKLGSYDFTLKYDAEVLEFEDFVDSDPSDNINLPFFEVGNGTIRIWNPGTRVNSENPTDVPLGNLLFSVAEVGSGTIYVEEAVLKNEEGGIINYVDGFINTVGETITGVSEDVNETIADWFEEGWKWWYNVKDGKDLCIDAFIAPGAGADEAAIRADIAKANQIFSKVANNCNCKFYLNFVLNSVTVLTEAQWNAVDADGDDELDNDGDSNPPTDEVDEIMKNHPATGNCIPVYYVPSFGGTTMGLTRETDDSKGVAVNNNVDGDNRTLAHELAHKLSKNVNIDQGHAKAPEQGADTPGNLMHYDNTGDNLTKVQCEEMEANLP